MKNKLFYCITVIVLSVVTYSCEDFLEVDLGKNSVTVIAPANNITSSSYNQLFKWEDLKGAESYQLQIAKPNFIAIQQFIMDTTTSLTQFSYVLSPGTYQWRLRALNSSSQTEYQTFNLTIDSTLNLSFSTLQLNLPADNHYSNTMTNTFTWLTLPNAETYILQVLLGGTTVPSIQSYADPINTGTFTFPAQGVYQWRVYAQNSTSNSAYITRTITIDTAAPNIPTYISPSSDVLTVNPIPLKWNTSTTADFSHLQISTDSLFASGLGDTKDTIIPNTGISVTYNFYSAVIGQPYFWRVEDLDYAGNTKGYFYRKRIKRI